ncbi:TPA: hypothetical protein ACJ270_004471 [Salmonella enterica subsp. enterica serovar Newport]
MSKRIVNAESYIYSAIICVDKKSFTTNEIANILIERFSLPKSLRKAKAFSYHQFQMFVQKGLLEKSRQKGIYQHLYSRTEGFNLNVGNVQLIQANQCIIPTTVSILDNKKLSAVNELLEKCEEELERISGLIEIYEELSLKIPEMKSEFKCYAIENIKKSIRVSEKIKALIDVRS